MVPLSVVPFGTQNHYLIVAISALDPSCKKQTNNLSWTVQFLKRWTVLFWNLERNITLTVRSEPVCRHLDPYIQIMSRKNASGREKQKRECWRRWTLLPLCILQVIEEREKLKNDREARQKKMYYLRTELERLHKQQGISCFA